MFWIILGSIVVSSILVYIQQINEANALIGTETRKKNSEELARLRMTKKCVSAKLKNVYKTYQDVDSATTYELCLRGSELSYVNTITTIEQFSIPVKQITSIQCDTFERLTITRFLITGLLAFAIPKKTYCIVVNYKDDTTGQEEQLLFSTNNKHDVFINNVIIARNSCRG